MPGRGLEAVTLPHPGASLVLASTSLILRHYHANMGAEEREGVQRDWSMGRVQVGKGRGRREAVLSFFPCR